MITSQETEERERDKLIFDLVRERLNFELQYANNLDTKASNIIIFVGIVVGFLLGVSGLSIEVLKLKIIVSFFFIAGVALLMASMILALLGYKIKAYETAPATDILIKEYSNRSYRDVIGVVTYEMSKATITNSRLSYNKSKYVNRSWYFLVVGLAIAFIFVVLLLLRN